MNREGARAKVANHDNRNLQHAIVLNSLDA
jgi:hypothetical protein